jgi:hypothetical protein
MRLKTLSVLLALGALVLVPQPASAEIGKAALVIGNATYQAGHPLAACGQSARDVGTWLRQQGFEVEQVDDASAVAMRGAIGNFITRVSGAPPKTAIVYICTYAAVSNQRLFMLPVDSDPRQPAHLETQGVIIKALLNTLSGTNGVLFADLGLQPDKNAADAIDVLQSGLPPGVHFAVIARNDSGIGTLGRSLPSLLAKSGQDWGRLSAAFQELHGPAQGDRLAVFAPLAGPIPPPADVIAETPASPPPAPSQPQSRQPAVPAPAPPPVATAAVDPATASGGSTGQPAAPTGTDVSPQPPVAEPPKPAAAKPPQRQHAAVPHPIDGGAPADARTGRIQSALARRGLYSGPVNSRLDNKTKEAIRAFQLTLGDAPSGILTDAQVVQLLNIGR